MGFRARSSGLRAGIVAVIVGLGLTIGLAPSSRAQESKPDQIIVRSIELVDADLMQAIRFLMTQTGVEIVVEPSDKPYGKITLSLTNKPLDQVLSLMARSAGASVRVEGGVYIVGPKGLAPQPAPKVEPENNNNQTVHEPVVRKLRTERIRLQNARPSELLAFLQPETDGILNRVERELLYANLDQIGKPWTDVQKSRNNRQYIQSLNDPDRSVPPVVPTKSDSVREEKRAPDAGADELQFGFGGGRGGFGGGRGGGLGGGIGGGGLGGGFGGGQGGIGGGLGGGLGGGIGGGGVGGGGAGSLLPDDIEAVIAYDVDNTIIARGTDESIRELKEIIRLLDIAPRQLMIKSEFIQVDQSNLRQFGIDWQLTRGNVVAGAPGFAAGQVFVNYATGNLVANLRTSLTEGRGRLVSAPMVTTLNNVPVNINIGRQIPVFITSPVAAGNGTVVLQTQLQVVSANSGMFVLPRINGDDTISLFIVPYVIDVVGQVTGPEGITAPILSQQIIGPISRRIKNGETMVIAGLATKNDSSSSSKVPLFGDLPLIGQLFRSRDVRVNDTELLVFVTPTILRETTGGATGGGPANVGGLSITP